MKFKKSQSGRSMVEMLGVLAIIGVLSVGGIAGYTLSMRRHRANGVVDTVSKYSFIYYSWCQKQLLDQAVPSINQCNNTELVDPIKFEETGIGDLPAGVTRIGWGSVYPNPNGSGDIAEIDIQFSDPKLCQAVASITGAACRGTYILLRSKHN